MVKPLIRWVAVLCMATILTVLSSSLAQAQVDAPVDDAQGALIVAVISDSPASDAGLQPGDVIAAIDDEPVEDPESLSETIQNMDPGTEIALEVYRPGKEQAIQVEVVLGEHPQDTKKAYLGVEIGGHIHLERHFEDNGDAEPFRFFGLPEGEWPERGQRFEFHRMPRDEDIDLSDLFGDSI